MILWNESLLLILVKSFLSLQNTRTCRSVRSISWLVFQPGQVRVEIAEEMVETDEKRTQVQHVQLEPEGEHSANYYNTYSPIVA